jgi:hypothetical protein
VTIINLLGFSDADGVLRPSPGFCPPDLHRLLPAAARAMEAFAPHAHGANMRDVHPVSRQLPASPPLGFTAPLAAATSLAAAPLDDAAPPPPAAPLVAVALPPGGARKRRRLG